MDEIAREAGVSKATLYAYFSDKRALFSAIFRKELRDHTATGALVVDADLPPDETLPRFLQALARQFVSPLHVDALRLSIGEAGRFPDLARDYYDALPARHHATLVECLHRYVARDELAIDDVELAADQLIKLSGALLHDRAVFLGEDCDDMSIRRSVDGAVAMFMSRYRPCRPHVGAAADCIVNAGQAAN